MTPKPLNLVFATLLALSAFAHTAAGIAAEPARPGERTIILNADPNLRQKVGATANWIEDYGSFVVVSAPQGALKAAGEMLPTARVIDGNVYTRGMRFDPERDNPEPATADKRGRFESAKDAGDDFIIQFAAPVRDAWLDDLQHAGFKVITYLPTDAFLVHGPANALPLLQQHPRVRWTGVYQPAYRLPPNLQWAFGSSKELAKVPALDTYEIAIAKQASSSESLAALALLGGQILHVVVTPTNYFDLVRVQLPAQSLASAARLSGVISIDRYIPPTAEDERAAQIVAGNFTNATTLNAPGYDPLTQFGVNGNNVTVAVSDDGVGIPGDGGFYVTAGNTANANLRGATAGAQGHGHLQASIIAGAAPFSTLDPLGYNYGLGIAPAANILNIPFLRTGYTGTDANAVDDAVTTPGPNGVKANISNNSWGNGTNSNAYDSLAATYDGFVRDSSVAATNDALMLVFSAGNQGATGLTRPKVAKNILSVAASENVRPTSPSAGGSTGVADNLEQLPDFSSRGPAADTRIKPDLTAPGDAITGGRSGTDVLFGNVDTFHRISSGTSHAAPQVAGAAALFTQFWKNNNAGAVPSPAMIKAALINSAVEMTGTGATAPIPNGAEGWGRINLQNVFTATPVQYIDQTQVLGAPGDVYTFNGSVVDPTKELRVALVWTDPPGAVDPALVNNLDLEVEVGGTLYLGNVFSAGVSTTGGVANNRDNVERVLRPAGIAGGTSLVVRVRATGLNGDGALGNADTTDQHFALVCLNCVSEPGFAVSTSTGPAAICAGTPISRTVNVASILGFNAPVTLSSTGLPAPGTISFTPNPVSALPGTSTLTGVTTGVAQGQYTINVTGTAGAVTRSTAISLFIASAAPTGPTLTAPADAAINVATAPVLTWGEIAGASGYVVEIATDAAFTNIVRTGNVTTGTYTVTPNLNTQTQYFWRVRASNACGAGGNSTPRSFTTFNLQCFTGPLAIPDNTPAGVNADITIAPGAPNLTSLRITVDVTHTYVGDLTFTLSKDGGTPISIYSPATNCTGDNMNISMFDAAAGTANTCANATPAVSGNIKPATLFGALNTVNPAGVWRLTAVDRANIDTGTINSWCIDLPAADPNAVFANGFE